MLRVIHLLLILSFLASCSSLDKKGDTPESAFAIAEEYEKDDRYEEAIRRFKEVKNKFPYSSFATKAELRVADLHFKSEEYAEAQVEYQAFRDLHPKHPQIDYVLFRIGLSYYNQLPSTIDRDLSLAGDTVLAFNDLLARYPASEHAKEGREYRDKTLLMLAEKEKYVADFYFRQGNYEAALNRYEGLYKKYPNLGLDRKALAGAFRSADRAGQKEKAQQIGRLLKQKYSSTSESDEAEEKESK